MQAIILSIKKRHKIILQIAFGLLFVALGIYFIKHELGELANVRATMINADPVWVLWGLLLLVAFIVIQGMMYQKSFEAIHEKLRLSTGISLYLKRNLVSVFLPAGMLTNMLFFNESVERKEGVGKTQTYFASSVFSICSILSGIVVGIPALVWLLLKQSISGQMILGVLLTAILLGLVIAMVISIVRKGWIFHFLKKWTPAVAQVMNEMSQQAFNRKKIWLVLGLSVLIEIIGISHLYIAVKALGGTPTLAMATFVRPAVATLIKRDCPDWDENSHICKSDLNHYRVYLIEEMMVKEKGELSVLDQQVIDNIRNQELVADNANEHYYKQISFGDRLADRIAAFGGSWRFIITFCGILLFWILVNIYFLAKPFDPYPFILFNLVLSSLAALQAPVIMMSQNRQEKKDSIREEHDYRINLKSELEIRALHEKLDHILLEQWQHILEIQDMQNEMMDELSNPK